MAPKKPTTSSAQDQTGVTSSATNIILQKLDEINNKLKEKFTGNIICNKLQINYFLTKPYIF